MLLSQSAAFSTLSSNPEFKWAEVLFEQFQTRFNSIKEDAPKFPCVFAQNAYNRYNIKFLLIPFDHEQSSHRFDMMKSGIEEYFKTALAWDGDANTADPLLAIFEPVVAIKSTCDYQRLFTDALQYLIDHDTHDWIGGIPQDPSTDYWTMCFGGTQLFINASHPGNKNRLSRNLCDALTLVINPRERFDVVAGATKKGELIREQIRKNIDNYDLIPRSPYLGHYQHGDLEWPQYMLPDDNMSKPMTCPLRFHSLKDQETQ